MAKNRGERKPRKRLGEWKHETRMVTVPGVGEVPARVIVVSHKGNTWEFPDTKDGRHRGSVAIQGVEKFIAYKNRVARLQGQVADLCKLVDGDAGDRLAQAADQMKIAMIRLYRSSALERSRNPPLPTFFSAFSDFSESPFFFSFATLYSFF